MVEVSERKEKEELESVMHVGTMTKSISKNLVLPICIGLKKIVIECKKNLLKLILKKKIFAKFQFILSISLFTDYLLCIIYT